MSSEEQALEPDGLVKNEPIYALECSNVEAHIQAWAMKNIIFAIFRSNHHLSLSNKPNVQTYDSSTVSE